MTEIQNIAELLFKHLQGTLSGEERNKLDKWVNESVSNRLFFEELNSEEMLTSEIAEHHEENKKKLEKTIFEKIALQIPDLKVVPIRHKRQWWKYAAAAVVFAVLAGGGYFMFFNKPGKQIEIAKTTVPNDVKAPETNRAMITLENGEKVYIDSATSGTLARQGNVNVIKTEDGQIVYNGTSSKVAYNTLTNPRGSKVATMTLSDGSHVWLNAGSSVTYPVAFVGSERKVSITGEAYFEVTKDATKKFIVDASGVSAEVLGTHFNVNAYSNETNVKVTLLEGLIKVSGIQNSESQIIRPGQQALVADKINVINNIDADEVMAWKNGMFQFNRTNIVSIMRQVERWYDVEVVFQDAVKDKDFTGGVARTENVSEVLKMLEKTGVIHFKIEGRKITVMN